MNDHKIEVGYSFSHDFVITDEQVRKFAEASGDFNPIHFDAQYCLNTKFKRPIVHGLLTASIFSMVYGNIFPGEGTIYVSQTLEFKIPIFPNEKYQAKFKIVDINQSRHRLTISSTIVNEQNALCLSGESVLYNKIII